MQNYVGLVQIYMNKMAGTINHKAFVIYRVHAMVRSFSVEHKRGIFIVDICLWDSPLWGLRTAAVV